MVTQQQRQKNNHDDDNNKQQQQTMTTTIATAHVRGPPQCGVGQDKEYAITDTWGVFTSQGLSGPKSQASQHISYPPQISHQQLLLPAGDVETKPGPAPRCEVCNNSATAKAVIFCTCQKSIHHSYNGITKTMQIQWCQINNHQCPDCLSVSNSQILCCKCGKVFRLNHNRATCGVCDATASLACTTQSR